jgi:hypothetical protein
VINTEEVVATILWRLAWVATAVLFLLKLTRWVDWSWWWVFTPLYIMVALVVTLFALGILLTGLSALGRWISGLELGRKRRAKKWAKSQAQNGPHNHYGLSDESWQEHLNSDGPR